MSMIQISKRQKGTSKLVDVLIRIGAIVLSLIFIGIVLAIMGYDPFKVFGKIIQTPFKRFKDVMNKTIMLTTLSLGIAIAFRMKFWNIGAEGQFYMGAFGAASMAFMCPDLPPILLLPLMCVAGFVCARCIRHSRRLDNNAGTRNYYDDIAPLHKAWLSDRCYRRKRNHRKICRYEYG